MFACDSSSRERDWTCASSAAAWIAPVASTSCSTASAKRLGVVSPDLLAERAHEHGLERGDVAGHVRRAAPRAPPPRMRRQRGRPLGLVLRELVRIALALRIARTMSLISSGSSRAIRSVGSSRISSSEARSMSRTSQALASSSRDRSRRASGPRTGVISAILPPETADRGGISEKIARVSDLISIAEARRRVLEAVPRLGDEASRSTRRSAACSPRT